MRSYTSHNGRYIWYVSDNMDTPNFGSSLKDVTSDRVVTVIQNSFTLVGTVTNTNTQKLAYSIPTKMFDFDLGPIVQTDDGKNWHVCGVVKTKGNLMQEEHVRVTVMPIENNFAYLKLMRKHNDSKEIQ